VVAFDESSAEVQFLAILSPMKERKKKVMLFLERRYINAGAKTFSQKIITLHCLKSNEPINVLFNPTQMLQTSECAVVWKGTGNML